MLKARPTPAQLQDRQRDPVPDGIELYLDREDLIRDGWLATIDESVAQAEFPASFTWIVEAPIRTIRNQYFDLTNDDEDHRETIRRVLAVGASIGAVAANIHVVAPTFDSRHLTSGERERALERTEGLLTRYVDQCRDFGMVPQVENIPPVGRMRESAYVFSPIGATTTDLLALADRFDSLRFTADVSHAGLFVNWVTGGDRGLDPRFQPVVSFFSQRDDAGDVTGYLESLGDRILTIHVSNADGLLGEGLGYADGSIDLDRVLARFTARPIYLVTETLESRPDQARGMRDAQRHLLALRDGVAGRARL